MKSLLNKVSSFKDEGYSLQERVEECGYSADGNPDYAGYLKALAEAEDKEIEVLLNSSLVNTETDLLGLPNSYLSLSSQGIEI